VTPPLVVVHHDAVLLARAVAARLVTALVDAQAARGRASVVLTGGGIGIAALRELAASPARDAIEWRLLDVWWGDERCVPPDDENSNYKLAKDSLLDRLHHPPRSVHRIKGELGKEVAAADYERELDDAPLDLLAFVLAGDKTSRLYRTLVYERQVAQDVSAAQFSGRLAGHFTVDVTPKQGQAPAALARAVDEELRRVAEQGVTERELQRAQASYETSFLDRLASVNQKADLLNAYNYLAGTPDYVRQDAARYQAVTAADVQRVARAYLRQPKVVLTVVPEGRRALALRAAGGSGVRVTK